MFVIYFVLGLVIHAWSLPTELKECEYCRSNSVRCAVGQVVQNSCVRCQCSEEHVYQCEPVSPPCDAAAENIILGKPTQARCEPHMVYVQNSLICMCSKGGYWPHEKCESTFRTLYNSESEHSEKISLDEASGIQWKCTPDSYIFQDCNVCRCNTDGALGRCTQNDCSKKVVIRRTYDNVHGSCIPNNWYSLAPCQFCHCQQTNKLVCSTRYKDYRSLKLGAYNLTDCGQDFLKELHELAPDGPVNLLRDGAMPLHKPSAQISTTNTPLTKRKPPGHPRTAIITKSRQYDTNVEFSLNLKNPVDKVVATAAPAEDYESEEEETVTEALRIEQSTLGLFENNEESAEDKKPSSYVRLPDGSYKPIYDNFEHGGPVLRIPPTQETLHDALMQQGLPKEMVQVLTSMPEVKTMKFEQEEKPQHNYDFTINAVPSQNQPHVLRINIPSVLDSIIKMALRKSMVKIEKSQTCMPGATTQEGCNFCYCLANGKLLCTVKDNC